MAIVLEASALLISASRSFTLELSAWLQPTIAKLIKKITKFFIKYYQFFELSISFSSEVGT
ncbi:hypothetical protein A1D05_11475 [Acinetobacter baumannii]|nr:hypothetical protein A1D05_11475 [Acinetobacter baumannii]